MVCLKLKIWLDLRIRPEADSLRHMSFTIKESSASDSPSPRPAMSNSPRSPSYRAIGSTVSTANGLAKSTSTRGSHGISRSNRGSVIKKPSSITSFHNTTTNVLDDAREDDARADNLLILEDLKNQLRKAETASEEYQRQLGMLQAQLNDSMREQGNLEERVQEGLGKIETLENDKLIAAREKRELENQFGAERTAITRDRDEQKSKEEELQSVNQRLREALVQRDLRHATDEDKGLSRSSESNSPSIRKSRPLMVQSEQPK